MLQPTIHQYGLLTLRRKSEKVHFWQENKQQDAGLDDVNMISARASTFLLVENYFVCLASTRVLTF